jgi:hypothetical protein
VRDGPWLGFVRCHAHAPARVAGLARCPTVGLAVLLPTHLQRDDVVHMGGSADALRSTDATQVVVSLKHVRPERSPAGIAALGP